METVKLNGATLPDFSIPTGTAHSKHQIHVNIAAYVAVAEDLCFKSGVILRYYETPCRLTKLANNDDRSCSHHNANWFVTTVSQGQFREIYCRQLVDCTGNGQLCEMAGAKRMREDETQPGTFRKARSRRFRFVP